ncbi:hypothetical protein LWI28_013802 [Acer negundo]|uniref:Cyclin n=1 Tax=Acer negundo TaxID=4023 RepID=A0AAD5J5R4_ACENE|nr:hypothetical protein LWI28_013802 [Acer negundo]KAK4850916.1 hypothetical protein QYF36_010956 [Acer negundo]
MVLPSDKKLVELESETYSALGLDDSSGRGISGNPRVLSLLSSILERSIQKNESSLKVSRKQEVVTLFHGSKAPSMSIGQYIERIFKYSTCSPSCLVLAYVYINRYLQRINASLTSLVVHRLLITSIMVAAKYIDDECYNNAYFAKVGGVSTAELNGLEMKFLFTLDFKLHVTTEAFRKYCSQLEMEAAGGRRPNKGKSFTTSYSFRAK